MSEAGLVDSAAPAGTREASTRLHHDFGGIRIAPAQDTAQASRYRAAFIGEVGDTPVFNGADAGTLDAGTADAGTSADAGTTSPAGGGGCTAICNRAYADPALNFGGGGVICDGATMCACAFDVPPLRRGQCPGHDAIVLAHERAHFADVDCNPSRGLHRPPFRDPARAVASECAHRRTSIADIDRILPGSSGICRTGMQAIRGQLNTWVRANCGGS